MVKKGKDGEAREKGNHNNVYEEESIPRIALYTQDFMLTKKHPLNVFNMYYHSYQIKT